MKNTILITWNELQQQIDLTNFYMGESAKRKDPDADTIQSSKDDEELLIMFAKRACNELVTAVALRFPSISCSVDNRYIILELETCKEIRKDILPILKQAMSDYIANEVTMLWLLTRQPQMAQTSIASKEILYMKVQHLFAKIYNSTKKRLRATDLAGI